MTAAAFQATIHGLRTVPSRGVVQLVLECPIEQLPHIAAVAEHGAWVAVARLNQKGGEAHPNQSTGLHDNAPRSHPPASGARKSFHELSGAQQAGILCNERSFTVFLEETRGLREGEDSPDCVRRLLGVTSRKDIAADDPRWVRIVSDYRAWQHEPEVVG
jgi:hypothetical protein